MDKYADLRDAVSYFGSGDLNGRDWIVLANPETIRTLLADYDRMRGALRRLEKGFKAGRDNANSMFRESGNLYHNGRGVAYDQAASDVRAALAQEHGGRYAT